MSIEFFLLAEVGLDPWTEKVLDVALKNGYEQNTGSPGILESLTAFGVKSKVGIVHSPVVPRAGQALVRIPKW